MKIWVDLCFVTSEVSLINTGCLSAKGDVSINPDREKYLVCCQFSKLFMVLSSGNFCQINFLRFLLPLAASTASNRKGAKICKNHGFLSKNPQKMVVLMPGVKKYINISRFLEEKRLPIY